MKHLGSLLAGVFLLATVQQAAADAGYTTGGVNCRSGAGTNYYVVAALPAYFELDIDYCNYGWCFVSTSYGSCYVSERYIGHGQYGGGGGGGYVPPPRY